MEGEYLTHASRDSAEDVMEWIHECSQVQVHCNTVQATHREDSDEEDYPPEFKGYIDVQS